MIINEKHNNKGKEVKQEHEEKIKVLEVENEVFERIIWSLAIEKKRKLRNKRVKTNKQCKWYTV